MAQLEGGSRFGGFQIESVLGAGGMGVVYRAIQLALDRTVALKLIASESASDEDFRERFKRESRTAASIEHPNVVTVYEAGEADGQLYIAMRYVEGTDLRALIATEGALEAPRAANLLSQIAAGLDAAHASGLVHRDVKPANILIAAGDHAYLTDFGLTKRTTSVGPTKTGQWVGTADYVAPEQIKGDPVDARADVYALGCVLYHMLSGKPPFIRDSEIERDHGAEPGDGRHDEGVGAGRDQHLAGEERDGAVRGEAELIEAQPQQRASDQRHERRDAGGRAE